MRRIISGVIVLTLLASLGLAGGCAEAPSATTALPAGMGMLKVYVTDPPPPDMDEILVTIEGLEVHKDGGPWVTVDEEEHQFDLKSLVGIQDFLASKVVDAGWYTQGGIRNYDWI